MHDRTLWITALRASRIIAAADLVSVRYTVDVLPAMIATANREYDTGSRCVLDRCPRSYLARVQQLRTAYGVGLAPLGLETVWFRSAPASVVLSLSGGGAFFTRPIPDPEATRFNFTAEGVAGVRIRLPRTSDAVITAGLRWHHISNGFTGQVNPALDSRLLYLALVR